MGSAGRGCGYGGGLRRVVAIPFFLLMAGDQRRDGRFSLTSLEIFVAAVLGRLGRHFGGPFGLATLTESHLRNAFRLLSSLEMTNPYLRREWKEFRAEVIEADGGQCCKCGRSESDQVILQVHHLRYSPRVKPWEYSYSDCETLCKGCHAREHGIIRPNFGWDYVGDDDLGDLSGSCEACGTEIRYLFHIQHPHWEPLVVGTICCDNLTGTTLASNHIESVNRFRARRGRFVASTRWTTTHDCSEIKQKGLSVKISHQKLHFQISMNHKVGKKVFPTLEAAKQAAFDVIESGAAEKYLKKCQNSRVVLRT